MTNTLISTDTITAGVAFTFTAAGDSLTVLPGATLASTGSAAVSGLTQNNISLNVLGTVSTSAYLAFFGSNPLINIGTTGTLISSQRSSSAGAITLYGGGGVLINEGLISSSGNIGVLSEGTNSIINSGTIAGSSGVFIGLVGATGDSFVNSGLVTANTFNDANEDYRLNNAVIAEGANSIITNLAEGELIAVSTEGAGISVQGTANGTVVSNAGLVHSNQFWGVDFGFLSVGNTAKLTNTGTIEGGDGAFRGSNQVDTVMNRGLMQGDVMMQSGNDVFDNRDGIIIGNWFGGVGADYYRGAFDADVSGMVLGEAGNDTLFGGRTDDQLNGGSENDLVQGGGGDDLLIGDIGLDSLLGGAGDDTLTGSGSVDRLTGGAGVDVFVFVAPGEFGAVAGAHDVITDFTHLTDVIDLSAIDAKTTAGGNQAFVFIGAAAFSGAAGQLRYDATSGIVEGDTNGDLVADFKLDLISKPTITVDDFIL